MNKKTFCTFPFNTIFLGADSNVQTCCSARSPLGNLNNDSIESIIHGPVAQEVREYILKEKQHPQCVQCFEIEKMGGRSERNSQLEDEYERFSKMNLDSKSFTLEKLDLRWSNTCNLACNYCYEYFSSQWSNIKGIKVNTLKEDNQETLFLFIEKNKDSVININLLGGEPFLQKQNSRLIELLKDKRYYVLTNLAVPLKSNKIAQQVLAEPHADWGVSFETIGKRYEYVRHGASWDQFNSNIDFLKERKPDLIFNAHPLYCTYSAFNIVEYYDYVLGKGFNGIYWCVIRNIDGLNVAKLPKRLQERAIKEIELCENQFKGSSGIDHLTDIKEALINSLDNITMTDNKFATFTQDIEKQLTGKEFRFSELWPKDILE